MTIISIIKIDVIAAGNDSAAVTTNTSPKKNIQNKTETSQTLESESGTGTAFVPKVNELSNNVNSVTTDESDDKAKTAEIDKLEGEKKKLEAEKEELETEKNNLKAENENLKKKVDELNKQIKQLQENNHNLSAQINTETATITSTTLENNILKKKYKDENSAVFIIREYLISGNNSVRVIFGLIFLAFIFFIYCIYFFVNRYNKILRKLNLSRLFFPNKKAFENCIVEHFVQISGNTEYKNCERRKKINDLKELYKKYKININKLNVPNELKTIDISSLSNPNYIEINSHPISEKKIYEKVGEKLDPEQDISLKIDDQQAKFGICKEVEKKEYKILIPPLVTVDITQNELINYFCNQYNELKLIIKKTVKEYISKNQKFEVTGKDVVGKLLIELIKKKKNIDFLTYEDYKKIFNEYKDGKICNLWFVKWEKYQTEKETINKDFNELWETDSNKDTPLCLENNEKNEYDILIKGKTTLSPTGSLDDLKKFYEVNGDKAKTKEYFDKLIRNTENKKEILIEGEQLFIGILGNAYVFIKNLKDLEEYIKNSEVDDIKINDNQDDFKLIVNYGLYKKEPYKVLVKPDIQVSLKSGSMTNKLYELEPGRIKRELIDFINKNKQQPVNISQIEKTDCYNLVKEFLNNTKYKDEIKTFINENFEGTFPDDEASKQIIVMQPEKFQREVNLSSIENPENFWKIGSKKEFLCLEYDKCKNQYINPPISLGQLQGNTTKLTGVINLCKNYTFINSFKGYLGEKIKNILDNIKQQEKINKVINNIFYDSYYSKIRNIIQDDEEFKKKYKLISSFQELKSQISILDKLIPDNFKIDYQQTGSMGESEFIVLYGSIVFVNNNYQGQIGLIVSYPADTFFSFFYSLDNKDFDEWFRKKILDILKTEKQIENEISYKRIIDFNSFEKDYLADYLVKIKDKIKEGVSDDKKHKLYDLLRVNEFKLGGLVFIDNISINKKLESYQGRHTSACWNFDSKKIGFPLIVDTKERKKILEGNIRMDQENSLDELKKIIQDYKFMIKKGSYVDKKIRKLLLEKNKSSVETADPQTNMNKKYETVKNNRITFFEEIEEYFGNDLILNIQNEYEFIDNIDSFLKAGLTESDFSLKVSFDETESSVSIAQQGIVYKSDNNNENVLIKPELKINLNITDDLPKKFYIKLSDFKDSINDRFKKKIKELDHISDSVLDNLSNIILDESKTFLSRLKAVKKDDPVELNKKLQNIIIKYRFKEFSSKNLKFYYADENSNINKFEDNKSEYWTFESREDNFPCCYDYKNKECIIKGNIPRNLKTLDNFDKTIDFIKEYNFTLSGENDKLFLILRQHILECYRTSPPGKQRQLIKQLNSLNALSVTDIQNKETIPLLIKPEENISINDNQFFYIRSIKYDTIISFLYNELESADDKQRNEILFKYLNEKKTETDNVSLKNQE